MYVNKFAGAELHIYQEMPSAADMEELLSEWGITDSTQERMFVLTYDSVENIRLVQEVAKGGYHTLQIPLPPMMAAVLLSGTDRFKIVHNHPSGDTSPTQLDVDTTRMVMDAANTLGLFFEDHLIVGPGADTFSFLGAGLIIPSVPLIQMAHGPGHRRAQAS